MQNLASTGKAIVSRRSPHLPYPKSRQVQFLGFLVKIDVVDDASRPVHLRRCASPRQGQAGSIARAGDALTNIRRILRFAYALNAIWCQGVDAVLENARLVAKVVRQRGWFYCIFWDLPEVRRVSHVLYICTILFSPEREIHRVALVLFFIL